MNFQIGPVPVTLSFGYSIYTGVRIGYSLNYGLTEGFSAGGSVGPYLRSDAFLAAGIGFDWEIIAASIGIRCELMLFDFYVPLKAQMLLKPQFEDGDIAVRFYLTSSLIPEYKMLSGAMYLYVTARLGSCPWCIEGDYTKRIFKFDPLIEGNLGNLLPIKPISINLFTLGQAMKLLE